MLQKLSTAFGIVLLASSFAFAGQSTTPAPSPAKPATTAGVQQSPTNAPVKKHKKHHKGQKKQAKPATSSTQPKQ
jgi:hypothetical protein